MNNQRTLLIVVWVAFTAYTVYALVDHGVIGFIEAVFDNSATVQVFLDLAIAYTLFLVWMWGDSRQRGLPFWPYAIATGTLGSIGALPYLIHRAGQAPPQPQTMGTTPAG